MATNNFHAKVSAYLQESARVKQAIAAAGNPMAVVAHAIPAAPTGHDPVGRIVVAAETIAAAFKSGGKLLLCGNGGSAADCQHMATEFTNFLRRDVKRPALPAVALTTDTSFLTAYANDVDFVGVFSRQVQALGRPGDVLVAISTSGNSPNVLAAVAAARAIGMKTVALSGAGGRLGVAADVGIAVPSASTQHIQESHLAIEHIICEIVEDILFPRAGNPAQAAALDQPAV